MNAPFYNSSNPCFTKIPVVASNATALTALLTTSVVTTFFAFALYAAESDAAPASLSAANTPIYISNASSILVLRRVPSIFSPATTL